MSEDLAILNKQAIAAAQKHMGGVSWPTVMLVAAVLAGVATSLGLFAAGFLPAWAATLILAALTYFAYTPLHEAVHGNINGRNDRLQWMNDLCGYLVAPFIMVPFTSHRVEHFTHHRFTNQPDKDPDYMVSGMGKGPVAAIVTTLKFFWVQNTFFVREHWSSASGRERTAYCAEVAVSVGWRAGFVLLAPHTLSALAVVVIGYFLGGFFTAYWFAYRPHIPYQDPTRYRNTNSLIMPAWMKPVEWFWLGQNLHSIHHLFPRVPFYRYHALHREIEPIMRAQGTQILGIFSRRPVPAEASVVQGAHSH
ncbi:fatty acid desaturase [Algiphilus sp.]|uniref:fatty acid desaturase family protein n=1 Tax=Algiphilus sp. TaxID=1872431 RepID=UPI0032EC0759